MKNPKFPGSSGLSFEEPLIFESSSAGRTGYRIPEDDITDLDTEYLPSNEMLRSDIPGMPELSELDVVRHYTRLSSWNYSIDHGFYPLGSCTMKYNPKVNEKVAACPGFSNLHPGVPVELAQGALQLMSELETYLAELSGLPAVTLQPSAGAQGELTGMLIIKAYHESRGDSKRRVVLIPDSAHGTNPASCVIAGFETKTLKSGPDGCLDPEQLKPYLNENLAALMMTNPNTLGIFEKNAPDIAKLIQQAGGLVYMDGANLNALMGIVRPGELGVNVLHFNLHKTFSSPHGGGGPGSGPVAVSEFLRPYLPIPRIINTKDQYLFDSNYPESIGKVHNFYGNFGVLVRAYTYIRALGPDGLKAVTEAAVLNANYIKEKLKNTYHLPYDTVCKHECVFSDKNQQEHGISTLDIAKRLMDYGYHPPTVYFPLIVKGAIMIEPTETESLDTIDQFIDAMIAINTECETNPEALHNAPHIAKRKRLNETLAARNPTLRWQPGLKFPPEK